MDLFDIIELDENTLDRRMEMAEKGERLNDLVSDSDYRVREMVANHGQKRHLKVLIHDSNWMVRGEAVMNAPADILLTRDKEDHPRVRELIEIRKKELKIK